MADVQKVNYISPDDSRIKYRKEDTAPKTH